MNANYAVLGLLNASPNYGYELKKLYDKYFGRDKPILTGQVYSILGRLLRDKKVVTLPTDEQSGGPERVKYSITSEGIIELRRWLETPEEPSSSTQTTLYVKTILALLLDGEAAAYLDAQRHAHIDRMRQLINSRRSVNLTDKLLIDHKLFHIEADLRWIELTSSRITTLKEEICS